LALRTVGYRPRHVAVMVIAEICCCSRWAVTGTSLRPAGDRAGDRVPRGHLPLVSIGTLLAAVLAAGILASLAATGAALRSPLHAGLRSE
jgi:hypothetical protein